MNPGTTAASGDSSPWARAQRLVARVVHDKAARLATGLAAAIAIPAMVLFFLQFRSLSDLDRATGIILEQLASESTNRLADGFMQDLRAPYYDLLQRMTFNDIQTLNLEQIQPIVEDASKRHGFLDAIYIWSATPLAGEIGQIVTYTPAGNGVTRREDLTPDAKLALTEAADAARRRVGVALRPMQVDRRPNMFVFRLLYDTGTREHLTAFAAFRVDLDRFRSEFVPQAVKRYLVAPERFADFPPLVASIIDEQDHVVFQSAPSDANRYVHEATFPLLFVIPEIINALGPNAPKLDTWRIRIGYGEGATVASIVGARTGRLRSLMAALALIMFVGLFVVARAAAREVRLAELKSDFVSSVSHDLKTPLALIQLFAETLELGRVKTAERAQDYYRIINSEARKLTRLINNILDFSRIEAGVRHYRMESIELAPLVVRVLESLGPQLTQNSFTVSTDIDASTPPVIADPEALEQAIDNLVSNAMKYSRDERNIVVCVSQEQGYACISVADRGPGIAEKHTRRIFDKFYRVEGDSSTNASGAGLGLAIVNHIVQAHHGWVRVKSEPGRGSVFTLGFPIAAEGEVHETHSRDRGRAADAARPA